LLVLTDDTGGDFISEVDVFGVGTPFQNASFNPDESRVNKGASGCIGKK
jgi:hypothetical protein